MAAVDSGKPLFYFKVDISTDSFQSEDHYFFSKVKQLGNSYRPWIDLRARVIHLKQAGFTPEGSIVNL